MLTYIVLVIGPVLLWGTAFVFAFRAIATARTPQGSVAWVFFLATMPFLAIPAYLFFGIFSFRGYIIARRDTEEVVTGIAEFAKEHTALGDDDHVGYAAFEKIAQAPILSGNGFDILIDGHESFASIFEAMDSAETYILVQFYIVKDDQIGRALKGKMIEAAQRGVTVRFLFDAVGSSRLPTSYLTELEENGVITVNAHSIRGPRNRLQINFRNHRKTIIVDGLIGFTGGLNVGDEYLGRDPNFGPWRDTHCRLEGPVVLQLQLVFLEDWHWATKVNLLGQLAWPRVRAAENMDALIMATGPADHLETGSLYFGAAINAAKDRIWIASPYLVPEGDILTALKLAALKNVDVRIMVPAHADHYITWLAAYAYFDELIEVGVKILMYEAGFMHQKVLVVDESIASIGTTNMDNRSCRLNFEATAMFFDQRAARAVASMLEKDFDHCQPVTKYLREQPLRRRIGAPLARLFSPLL